MTMTQLTGTLTGMIPVAVAGGALHRVSRHMAPAARRRRRAVKRKQVAKKRVVRKAVRRRKRKR